MPIPQGTQRIMEVRINLSGGRIARVFLFCAHEGNMVLLHGFIKKSQKTPANELAIAVKRTAIKAMKKEIEKGRVGGSFSDFLKEQGTYEETTEQAVKRVIAHQLAAAMKESGINKIEMAKQLKTSRSQLDRLLDPNNDKVTLAALSRAAKAMGRSLRLELQ